MAVTVSTCILNAEKSQKLVLRNQNTLDCYNGLWPSKGIQSTHRWTVYLQYESVIGGGD